MNREKLLRLYKEDTEGLKDYVYGVVRKNPDAVVVTRTGQILVNTDIGAIDPGATYFVRMPVNEKSLIHDLHRECIEEPDAISFEWKNGVPLMRFWDEEMIDRVRGSCVEVDLELAEVWDVFGRR